MIKKIAIPAVFFLVSGMLIIYGRCSFVGARYGLSPICERMGLSDLVYYFEGRKVLYRSMDMDAAEALFRKSLEGRPDNMLGWIDLARAEFLRGKEELARSIASFVFAKLSQISTWKWEEFLLAYDLSISDELLRIYNYFLSKMGHRVRDANFVIIQQFGDLKQIVPYISRENAESFVRALMGERAPEALWAYWNRLVEENETSRLSANTLGHMVSFFTWTGHVRQAKEIWRASTGFSEGYFYNGGFEEEILNRPFGWEIRKIDGVVVERTRYPTRSGNYALRISFLGKDNIRFSHVRHVVPVEPGASYCLSFSCLTERITTDKLPYLMVRGYGCNGLGEQFSFPAETGSWEDASFCFSVPPGCEAIAVSVERQKSLKFDNKIRGDLILDDFSMKKIQNDNPEADHGRG